MVTASGRKSKKEEMYVYTNGSAVKKPPVNAGDADLIPGSGKSGEGNGNPLQYSRLENPRDRRAGWAAVYGVAQSRTRLKRLSNSSSSITPLK